VSFRWIEHTAELGLELLAPTREGVFAEGFAALAELLGEGAEPGGDAASELVEIEAADGATLLADWLAELAFLAETRGLVPVALEELEVGEASLRATVRGRLAHPDHLVKAVTYHGLSLAADSAGRWRGTVVFDV
jgi:SHS2 domain-containing protein